MKKTFQFTAEGFKKLQDEQVELTSVKRSAAVTRLSKARSMGDLSENSEYTAAKEELSFIEGRIKELEELIKNAEIVDSTTSNGVDIGMEVIVEKNGNEEIFSIVGEFEADPMQKKLSSTSPIGRALLGKKQGDIVSVEVPAGTLKYTIKEIRKA